MEFINEAKTLFKDNIRDYGMYIALFVIMLTFTIMTDGLFMSSRNISNLLDSTGYIAVLAVGMTLVIVIRHIDLSVGFVAGFLGAIAAILLTGMGVAFYITIPIILVMGIFVGLFNGLLVAKFGIPSFVATLAGMLIFRGALLQVTEKTGTIIVKDDGFNAIGNGFIPSIMQVNGLHLLTLILGVLAILLYIYSEISTRKNKINYQFEVVSKGIFIVKLVFVSAIISYITWILAGYNGFSWTVVIMLLVVVIYHFLTTKTVLGRHIYAVGSNPEAAHLSGINVNKITYIVFGSMGMLAALSGILFTSRLQSATTTAGTLFELDAIAAAYVGGVSSAGGVGKITGAIIGAVVMASLSSGMNLLGVGVSLQYMIRGGVLAGAVIFDVMTRKKRG
ncbi:MULTISPECIES: sugar ABC transporter permease [Cytobacillus]|jgi:putative multiple sugar transport system permease protein|uniref:Xylose transport system permease protein XylH n=1 Tax=Cytobacillus oceanisediminis 2691 TaxID=1196031 RepID=A0A160M7H2_9BACI|nr:MULTISPECIES: sugar ABC transporter permease [Cytobacillus]AND38163.1 ABC transporter permease [Cytobacillus oceanisediminis 2691]MBU8771683.1 sugar ABC transporter permease [Cytobacillus oceanisediminis]MCM3245170.1 sugar ABC transporter permease [Cytobacillus oceanisediminis]MCS0670256.1 sugar ABC transporter permease [Cytobacillus firmus]MCS0825376.1 sugar ABC transporter permease [Cytobacillus firmus]